MNGGKKIERLIFRKKETTYLIYLILIIKHSKLIAFIHCSIISKLSKFDVLQVYYYFNSMYNFIYL